MVLVTWTGREVRALRETLRWTQEQLARRLIVVLATVKKWEGNGAAQELKGRYADDLETLYHELNAMQRQRFWIVRDGPPYPQPAAPDPNVSEPNIAGSSEPSPDLDTTRFAYAEPFSGDTIDGLMAVTRLLAGQRQEIPPVALLHVITAHRDSVATLFRRATSEAVRRHLGGVLGETSIVASRLWSALGNRSLALATCAFARRLADEIADPTLGATARIFESNLRSDSATLIGPDGDVLAGLTLLDEAAAAGQLLPPPAQARLAAEQAQAFAVLELEDECRNALNRARRAADQIAEADRRGLFSDWDANRLRVYEGTCWLFLDQPDKALPILQEAAHATTQGNEAVMLAAKVDLASAHNQIGELDVGCTLLGDAYEGTVAMGNLRGIDRVKQARERLQKWERRHPVRDLDDRIASFTH